jgi:hypothetical protein
MFKNALHTFMGSMAFACSCSVGAQQVIATCGAEYTGPSVSIAMTIGQPVISTVSNSNNVLTQGFQQPWINITTAVEGSSEGLAIVAYPNPTRTEVFLEAGPEHHDLSWVLTDALGSLIDQGPLNTERSRVDVSALSSGTYFMRIGPSTGTPLKVFQLIITE